jgi:hypothetical protein
MTAPNRFVCAVEHMDPIGVGGVPQRLQPARAELGLRFEQKDLTEAFGDQEKMEPPAPTNRTRRFWSHEC